MRRQTIIIGGGHNGLTAAILLARGGHDVLVLERRPQLGGLAAAEEFHPGHRSPGLLHDSSRVRPAIVQRLGLELSWREAPVVCAPRIDAPALRIDAAAGRLDGAAREQDARAYGEHRAFIERVSTFVRRLLDRPPPDPIAPRLGSLMRVGRVALGLRRLGRHDMIELLRLVPLSVGDWMDSAFGDEHVRAAIAAPALIGAWGGPRSAGTAVQLLVREATAGREICGGPPALVAALVRAARRSGARLRTGTRVTSIRVEDGRTRGVTLANGEQLDATRVAASCDPRQTLLQLCPAGTLPARITDAAQRLRARGTTAKVHLALSGPLELAGCEEPAESIRIGQSLDQLERAFDAAKYGTFSEQPVLDIRVPTVADRSLCDHAGHHVVSILVHFAPYDLRGGWNDAQREALGDAVIATLARYAPALRQRIVARQVLTPRDIERTYGMSGGHVHHLEHALDQLLFLRPIYGLGSYATPIAGLFSCGSGSHPGGELTLVPGALAARQILRSA